MIPFHDMLHPNSFTDYVWLYFGINFALTLIMFLIAMISMLIEPDDIILDIALYAIAMMVAGIPIAVYVCFWLYGELKSLSAECHPEEQP